MNLTIQENASQYMVLQIELGNGTKFEIFEEPKTNQLFVRTINGNIIINASAPDIIYIQCKTETND